MKIHEYNEHMVRTYQEIYDKSLDSWTRQLGMRKVLDIVLENENKPIQSVLEIGGGRGVDALRMMDHVKTYVMVEPADTKEMRELAAVHAGKLRWIKDRFPVALGAPGAFSIILDNGCFHHEHPDSQYAYFSAINSVSDDETSLYISIFGTKSDEANSSLRTMPDGRHVSLIHPDQAAEFFEQFGWKIQNHWSIPNGHDKRPYNLFKLQRQGVSRP